MKNNKHNLVDEKLRRDLQRLFGREVGLVSKLEALVMCDVLEKKIDYLVSQLYIANPGHDIFEAMRRTANAGEEQRHIEAAELLRVLESTRQNFLEKARSTNEQPS